MRHLLLAALCLATLPAQAEDTRQPLPLSTDEATAVKAEMRGFLEGVQRITAAIAGNDMKTVAAAAHELGMSGTNHVPMATRMRFPLPFKEMGQATHMGFDNLSTDAYGLGDPEHATKQLGEVLQNCNACHASYRIEEKR